MIEDTDSLKDFIIHCLDEKKASNITCIDLGVSSPLARYMIIASGTSTKNIAAMADFVSLELKHKTILPVTIEGLGVKSEWVLLDVGDVIVHLFHPEARSHFRLEELWKNQPPKKT